MIANYIQMKKKISELYEEIIQSTAERQRARKYEKHCKSPGG